MLKKGSWNCSKSGFTLIELLVVISIISLLMSIMMPSLNRAREQANRVDCMNNMRQLTLAWTIYADDNDGQLCSPWAGWIDEDYGLPWLHRYGQPHWVLGGLWLSPSYELNHIGDSEIAITEGVLWPYTQNIELYRCKSDPSNKLRSYAIANTMGGSASIIEKWEDLQFHDISQISRSSERLVFADAQSRFRWLQGSFLPVASTGHSKYPRWHNWGESPFITTRHNDGMNISFADGHCRWWRFEDPETVRTAKGQALTKDPETHRNADAEYLAELLKGRN